MVARLDLLSVSLAQKPKSAKIIVSHLSKQRLCGMVTKHTNLDVTMSIQEHVVTLDIAVNNVLGVEVLQTLAGLYEKPR